MSSLSRRTMLKSLNATSLLLAGGGTATAARSGGVAADNTWFRVGHFSPDAPPVNVYVDGNPFPGLRGVPFGALSDYFTIPAGTCQIEMTPADDASTVVVDTGITFRRNHNYTVATANVLDAITPVVLTDTNRPVPYGKAGACIVHFPPDVPEVNIVIKDGLMLFSGLVSGDISQYEAAPAGIYDPQVALSSNRAVVLDLPGTTLPGGRTISVFAIEFATGGSSGFSVLPVVDAVSPARKPKPSPGGDVCRVG